MAKRYPINVWRTFGGIALCWITIAASIAAVEFISRWFYPLAFILIGNRLLALTLICHEGLHGNLHSHRKLNDFIARYFCAFPAIISFSKYRRLHLLHHSAVGLEKWDPDNHLYRYFPTTAISYLSRQLFEVLTLRTFRDFTLYHMEFSEFFTRKRTLDGRRFVFSGLSDFVPFVIFQTIALAVLLYFGIFLQYFFLIFLPLILFTEPYTILMGGLQHGPPRLPGPMGVSRSIRGSKLYLWFLLPCDIGYHAEHHLNPSVPHYRLHDYAQELSLEGVLLWKSSFRQALQAMFSP